jgi:hypothetical protein
MMTMNYRSTISMAFLALVMVGLITAFPLDARGQIGSGMPPNDHGQIPVIVKGIGFSDETPTENDVITISATISNNVSMDLKNITVVFLVDGDPIGNISGLSLDVNGSKIVEIKWTAEADTHVISAVISIGGKILTESQFSKEIVVDPEPLGNFITPALLLFAIFLLIGITTIFPGIVDLIRGNKN